MSDEQKPKERHAFEYMGHTWSVTSLGGRDWKYVPTWNAGKWDEAITILLGSEQYEQFEKTVRTQDQMNGFFKAYNKAVGGNS